MAGDSDGGPESPAVIGVGNALLDRTYEVTNIPDPDGGAFVLDEAERPGGVETNVAALAAGLGRSAGVIARLGTDDDGDRVAADLAAGPLDDRRVRQVDGDRTAYTLVLADPEGRRAIVGGGESTLRLRLDDADRAYLRGADAVVASGYAPAAVLRDLAALDTPLVFDLAGRFADLEHRGLTRGDVDAVLGGVDLFVANAAAARSYLDGEGDGDGPTDDKIDGDGTDAGTDGADGTNGADGTERGATGEGPADDPATLARRLWDRGARRGAVTVGADGAVLFDAAGTYRVPALDVDPVDTTGAGDAFTAGLLDAWVLDGRDPPGAGRWAAAVAAANCRRVGAREAPPTRAAVRALAADRGHELAGAAGDGDGDDRDGDTGADPADGDGPRPTEG